MTREEKNDLRLGSSTSWSARRTDSDVASKEELEDGVRCSIRRVQLSGRGGRSPDGILVPAAAAPRRTFP